MTDLKRRKLLMGAAASAAALGTVGIAGVAQAAQVAGQVGFGNPDRPPEGKINVTDPVAATDPGPQNPVLASQFPSSQNPPPTDINGMPLFWASFNNVHKRYQNGGWARQVTQDDFAISKDISGVNMRLGPNGIREMHWHQQAEWAIMLDGACRITILDELGRPQVADVKKGDLWYFPPGLPHSLMGIGPTGCEFLIAFDNGHASEFNTLLLTDWIAHTPPEVLAKNFGVSQETFKDIPTDNLWIFQGSDPGPLAAAQKASASSAGLPTHPFVFSLGDMKPSKVTKGGEVRIADSTNFKASVTVAVAMVTVKPGAMRELHWHPNADEWQYYISGKARMTVFNTGPQAVTTDFRPGDVGYIPKSLGHYVENIGDTDLVFLEIFKTDRYQEVSLANWLKHTPPELVRAHLNIDPAALLRNVPDLRADVVPV